MDASYAIDGVPCRREQISVRSMNFGQHWRTEGVEEIRYAVALPVAFVLAHLARELPEYVADCQLDTVDASTSALDLALRAAGWPSPETILDTPALAAPALAYFAHDLLLAWFGDGAPGQRADYVLNTVSATGPRGGVVTFTGEGRKAGVVRYQDA